MIPLPTQLANIFALLSIAYKGRTQIRDNPHDKLKSCKAGACHTAPPQQVSYRPVCVAVQVVLASRKPLKGPTVVPLRGGDRREDLRFESKTPFGDGIARIARPSDSESQASKRVDARWAIKPCSYVFVDATQTTRGLARTAKSPKAPGRRNAQ